MSQPPLLDTKMTAAQVITALRNRHRPKGNFGAADWCFFDEVRLGAGFEKGSEQRVDAWAIHCWPSKREMVAYEVKVSRSDFQHEMRKPTKRKLALLYSNRFYFATPAGLLKHEEVPPEAGLIEVQADGRTKVTLDAPWRECLPPSWTFVSSIARRVASMTTGPAIGPDEIAGDVKWWELP